LCITPDAKAIGLGPELINFCTVWRFDYEKILMSIRSSQIFCFGVIVTYVLIGCYDETEKRVLCLRVEVTLKFSHFWRGSRGAEAAGWRVEGGGKDRFVGFHGMIIGLVAQMDGNRATFLSRGRQKRSGFHGMERGGWRVKGLQRRFRTTGASSGTAIPRSKLMVLSCFRTFVFS
jgi:hypothetical protein